METLWGMIRCFPVLRLLMAWCCSTRPSASSMLGQDLFQNSLAPGNFEWNFRYVIFKQILVIDGWGISCEIALIWMLLDFTAHEKKIGHCAPWAHGDPNGHSQPWPSRDWAVIILKMPWLSCDLAVTELWPRRDWAVTSPSRDHWAPKPWPPWSPWAHGDHLFSHGWWSINIGSGNGLVPSGNKPLPEPVTMLIQIFVAVWHH